MNQTESLDGRKISVMEKKSSSDKKRTISSIENEGAPLNEIFLSEDLNSPNSEMNNFDREFKRVNYGPVSFADDTLEIVPKMSVWQRFSSFVSYVFSSKKKTFDATKKEALNTQEGVASPTFETKTEPSSKILVSETFSLPELITKSEVVASSKSVQQPTSSGNDISYNSQMAVSKKTTVYTHDLIFLTEQDRHEKYDLARKKRELEKSLMNAPLQQSIVIHDSNELLVQDRNINTSLLDVTNPVSRAPSASKQPTTIPPS